ncbi:hypothetical protein COY28_02095, partial [Candidatus Woesearchaeota archaeon CG_4_10_14_0_2_um_filter_57_5]
SVQSATGERSASTASATATATATVAKDAKGPRSEDAASAGKPGAGEAEHYTGSVVGKLEEASESMKDVPRDAQQSSAPADGVKATLLVRKLAQAMGVDISKVKGTGPQGRITEDDVKAAVGREPTPGGPSSSSAASPAAASPSTSVASSASASAASVSASASAATQPAKPAIKRKYDMWGYIDRQPFKGIRKTIATRMLQSQSENAPVTYHVSVNAGNLVLLREKEKKRAAEQGIKLTYLAYIVKAVALAVLGHTAVNSSLVDDEILLKKYANVGIAVDTEHGLYVPVIKRAETQDVLAIAKEISRLADAVKDNKLNPMDLKGGSISITNLGSVGVEYFTPVINPGECSVLGVGRMKDAPVLEQAADGKGSGPKVVPGRILPLSLTADHRIVDGAEAARFLNDVKRMLEDPGDGSGNPDDWPAKKVAV